jgi:2-polyprenyl-3-methyl-5-hydroxy-6-metoxy-1,4-benzoquinol methylase
VSVNYYNQNAETYFAATVDANVQELRSKFLAKVRVGGEILDAGCGSGRDAVAFHNAGYRVTAFDASPEMCRLAHQYTQLPILQMTFRDLTSHSAFDGIWACASLLHVPRSELNDVLRSLVAALRPHGALYVSFKHGTADRVIGGRHFTDMTEAELRRLLGSVGLSSAQYWTSDDVRRGRANEKWLNALAIKN